MKTPSILCEQEPEKVKPKRVDMEFEKMVYRCGLGCLIRGIPMDEKDEVRLLLAISRIGILK